jgi:hypothetical protein
MPSPGGVMMNDEWEESIPLNLQINMLINARIALRDVKAQHGTHSQVDKALDAAILSIELAWKMVEDAQVTTDASS